MSRQTMIQQTLQLWLTEGADASALESELSRRLDKSGLSFHLSRNLDTRYGGGDFTLDLVWGEAVDPSVLAEVPGLARVDGVNYQSIGRGIRQDAKPNTLWRTLMLRIKPGSDEAAVVKFERELLEMPDYMQGISRWSLGRVTSGCNPGVNLEGNADTRWTHVWQQEYRQLDDLVGEYLLHPFHWGWVDHYFDLEFPDCLVDAHISHNFCPLQCSLIVED